MLFRSTLIQHQSSGIKRTAVSKSPVSKNIEIKVKSSYKSSFCIFETLGIAKWTREPKGC